MTQLSIRLPQPEILSNLKNWGIKKIVTVLCKCIHSSKTSSGFVTLQQLHCMSLGFNMLDQDKIGYNCGLEERKRWFKQIEHKLEKSDVFMSRESIVSRSTCCSYFNSKSIGVSLPAMII
ncbi:hypothetical protein AMECASPLE_035634 [Ameca splendens]|uniref:Uncharacterized protein n=1 Tax=Ameca splendens TaxID=208324 RepID=A0ABV0ZG71_9TELE